MAVMRKSLFVFILVAMLLLVGSISAAEPRDTTSALPRGEVTISRDVDIVISNADVIKETTFVLPGGAKIEMVWIEPGTFTMGITEEQEQLLQNKEMLRWRKEAIQAHSVTITRGFWLGKYELTQGQWESVIKERFVKNGMISSLYNSEVEWEIWREVVTKGLATFNKEHMDMLMDMIEEHTWRCITEDPRPWHSLLHHMILVDESPNHPAVGISWYGVQAFIAVLNASEESSVYRLPTEAEWEYACRAGTTTLWSFGDDENQLGRYAWYDVNTGNVGEKYAHKVGTKLPNPWGLYDMYGNVGEWCQDQWTWYPSSAQTDPLVPYNGTCAIIRGGSFFSTKSTIHSGDRYGDSPRRGGPHIGARLVRQEPPA